MYNNQQKTLTSIYIDKENLKQAKTTGLKYLKNIRECTKNLYLKASRSKY